MQPPTDPLCSIWKAGKCEKCADRAYFYNGVCTAVSDHCQTWDALDGRCLTCYKGYNLGNGACVLADQKGPTDLGCKVWDWDNQKCLECSSRHIFSNGACVPVDNLCRTFDQSGACTACYKGYLLQNGKCNYFELERPQDLGCKVWNWDEQICFECSYNWVYRDGKGCVPVSTDCQKWNDNGDCTACYKGYNLANGACVLADQKGPSDLGCKRWDWDNQKCLECSARWTFDTNGVCQPVDNNCASWGTYGECTACYTGYAVNQGKCEAVNVVCKSTGADGACTACYNGYVLLRKTCVPISKLASLYQYYSECCPEKLASLQNEKRLL